MTAKSFRRIYSLSNGANLQKDFREISSLIFKNLGPESPTAETTDFSTGIVNKFIISNKFQKNRVWRSEETQKHIPKLLKNCRVFSNEFRDYTKLFFLNQSFFDQNCSYKLKIYLYRRDAETQRKAKKFKSG